MSSKNGYHKFLTKNGELTFLALGRCSIEGYDISFNKKTDRQIKSNVLSYMKERSSWELGRVSDEFKKISFDKIYYQSLSSLGENHDTTKSVKIIREFFSKKLIDSFGPELLPWTKLRVKSQ